MADYDVIVIGAGPGGIFSAYELVKANRGLKVAVFELGRPLDKRRCPIDGKKIKSCVKCNICNIMSGFGGAGAFSDGKYNITNQFGGTLYEHVGKQEAIDLMMYVDEINRTHGGEGTKLYSTANTGIKRMCLENGNVSKAVVTDFVYGYVYAPDAKAAEEAKKAAAEEARLSAEAAAQSEEADSAEDAAETAEPEVTAEAVQ